MLSRIADQTDLPLRPMTEIEVIRRQRSALVRAKINLSDAKQLLEAAGVSASFEDACLLADSRMHELTQRLKSMSSEEVK